MTSSRSWTPCMKSLHEKCWLVCKHQLASSANRSKQGTENLCCASSFNTFQKAQLLLWKKIVSVPGLGRTFPGFSSAHRFPRKRRAKKPLCNWFSRVTTNNLQQPLANCKCTFPYWPEVRGRGADWSPGLCDGDLSSWALQLQWAVTVVESRREKMSE